MPLYYALVDCNNFYASCERIFDPSLWGRPVIILSNNDGCVVARSQEAKEAGVPFAVPYFKIKDMIRAHNIAVFSSNYALYADISNRVMTTLHSFSPDIEVYSIDEAFLLFRNAGKNLEELGGEIRRKIYRDIGVPVSVGIAPTKTLAKAASGYAKRNPHTGGVVFLHDKESVDEVLHNMSVVDIWGIGPAYAAKLKNRRVQSAMDFSILDEKWVRKNMTITGLRTLYEVRGYPCIEFEEAPSPKKAILSSRSFGSPIKKLNQLRESLSMYTSRAAEKLRKQKCAAGAITVFVMTNRFRNDPQYSRSLTMELPEATCDTSVLISSAMILLDKIFREGFSYKKAGVMLSDLVSEKNIQKNLFTHTTGKERDHLMKTVDLINNSYGSGKIFYASSGGDKTWRMKREFLSPRYTTRWEDIPLVTI